MNTKSLDSLALTEKQQDAVWLRYGRHASIKQVAQWLKISRRAVQARLRNARRRSEKGAAALTGHRVAMPARLKSRAYSASQIPGSSGGKGVIMDDL